MRLDLRTAVDGGCGGCELAVRVRLQSIRGCVGAGIAASQLRAAAGGRAQWIVGGQIVDGGVERLDVALISGGSSSCDRASPVLRGVFGGCRSMSCGTPRYSSTCCATSANTGAETRCRSRTRLWRLSMTTATAMTGLLTGANAGEGCDVHGLRIVMRGGIDLLRGAGFAAGGVAVELRGLAGAEEHDAFHHLAHLRGGQVEMTRCAPGGRGLGRSRRGLNGCGTCGLRQRFGRLCVGIESGRRSARAEADRRRRWRWWRPW